MNLISKTFVKARESLVRFHRGQTMTEYALILAAVAIVVYASYQLLGQDIGTLTSSIDSKLTTAA